LFCKFLQLYLLIMTNAESFFLELLNEIPNAEPGKMFNSLFMKMPNGKSGAMFWRDHLVVKLQGEDGERAMELNGSKVFEPMEGRTMNGWIAIPFEHKESWKEFALISAGSVAALKGKASIKAKPKRPSSASPKEALSKKETQKNQSTGKKAANKEYPKKQIPGKKVLKKKLLKSGTIPKKAANKKQLKAQPKTAKKNLPKNQPGKKKAAKKNSGRILKKII
jgi:hypothetical protein